MTPDPKRDLSVTLGRGIFWTHDVSARAGVQCVSACGVGIPKLALVLIPALHFQSYYYNAL